MKSFCARCNTPIIDIAKIIMDGCSKCGSHKIIKNMGEEYRSDEALMKEKGLDKNVAIYIRGKGEYIVNLDALIQRADNQPIIVEDNQGRVNVLFNPDE